MDSKTADEQGRCCRLKIGYLIPSCCSIRFWRGTTSAAIATVYHPRLRHLYSQMPNIKLTGTCWKEKEKKKKELLFVYTGTSFTYTIWSSGATLFINLAFLSVYLPYFVEIRGRWLDFSFVSGNASRTGLWERWKPTVLGYLEFSLVKNIGGIGENACTFLAN